MMNTSLNQTQVPSSSYKLQPYFVNEPFDERHRSFLLTFLVINGVISPIASCINLAIIYTISSTVSLRTPSNILILGLSVSDFCASFVAQPSYCVYLFSEYKRNVSFFLSARNIYMPSNTMLGIITLFTLSAITADRFLAVQLHLRYQEFVTTQRCGIVLAVIWICSLLTSVGRILLETSRATAKAVYILAIVFVPSVLILDAFFIIKIHKAIRRHSAQIHAQQPSTHDQSINMPKYKKSVNAIYYVIGAFVVSYAPFIAFVVAHSFLKKWSPDLRKLLTVSETVLMCNGLLNPLIYCWRLQDVRNAVRRNMRNIFLKVTGYCRGTSTASA